MILERESISLVFFFEVSEILKKPFEYLFGVRRQQLGVCEN